MTKNELKIAGAMIYACEGTKVRRDLRFKNHFIYSIELTNSHPAIIQIFMKFLREILTINEERLRGQLFVYPDHNKEELVDFWNRVTAIPKRQFQKVILLKQKNKKFKPNPLGTFKIRYNHKVDFLRLQTMIKDTWISAGIS
jgi:hypothetical protein